MHSPTSVDVPPTRARRSPFWPFPRRCAIVLRCPVDDTRAERRAIKFLELFKCVCSRLFRQACVKLSFRRTLAFLQPPCSSTAAASSRESRSLAGMATTVVVNCTVETTESPTLAALQARREAREQRQAGLFQRLSNLRSLRAQLFDIKRNHYSDSVVLTGGEDIFQKEVDLIVAEIAKLKALREREAHTTEPRPLPPWLQFPAPAAGDDFLRRLQQAEQRDAASAAEIAAIGLAKSGPPSLRRQSSLSRLGGFVGNAARAVSGRLSRASMQLSGRLSRKNMEGSEESWRSEDSEHEPPSPAPRPSPAPYSPDRSPGRLPRFVWAARAPTLETALEGTGETAARYQPQAMRPVVAAQPAKPDWHANLAPAAAAARLAAALPDASSAAKLAAARVARMPKLKGGANAAAPSCAPSAALAKPRWGGPSANGNGTAKPLAKGKRVPEGKLSEGKGAAGPEDKGAAGPEDTQSAPASVVRDAASLQRLASRSTPVSPNSSSIADDRRISTPRRLEALDLADVSRVAVRSKGRRGSADPLSVFGLQTVGPIAAGAFSMVVRATDVETGCTVAVKTFNKARCSRDPRLASASAAELRVLRLLAPDAHHHLANLVRVHENVQSVHLVLEYCAGGSLQRRLQGLQRKGVPEAEAAMMSRQLCSAIAYLHARGVAHRDVKPANVLYVDGASGGEGSIGGGGSSRLKLCDFGFATFVPAPGRCHTRCGTPIYMAPELHKDGKEGYLPAPIDCWALGALVFELLHAKQAFSAETIELLVSRVRNASHASFTPTISTQAKDFIQALLTIKAAARCTAKQALEHAWLATTPPADAELL